MPVDIAWEALVGNATFVARSFAGDPKQVKELIKAALSHNGIAVLDIISPCVTFNNKDDAGALLLPGARSTKWPCTSCPTCRRRKRSWWIMSEGEAKEVTMHDGSTVILKKLEHDYDPTNRAEAMRILEEANAKQLAAHRADLHQHRTSLPCSISTT